MDITDNPPTYQRGGRRRLHGRSLAVVMFGLLVFAIAAVALFLTLRYDTLRIAVGPTGSNDVKLIDAMAKTFARERGAIRLLPQVSESAELALTQFKERKADLAVVRSDELPPDAQAIAILRKNVLVLWVPGTSKNSKKGAARIVSVDQLAGRKIGLLGRAPANLATLKMVLAISGVVPDKAEIVQFPTSEMGKLAADPSLDAYATIGPSDSRITADALSLTARSRGELKILAIDASEAFVKKYPHFESAEIPANSFSSSPARPEEAIETIGLSHLIVAHSSVSDTKGANLARQIFAQRQALLRELPGIATLEKPDTDKDASIPVHPGAAAYIDGTERTFVEKYSDFFWGALLVFSGLGSAGAWFRAYFKKDEKAQHVHLRDRLLDLIARLRGEQSVDEIERMEAEADDILRDTVACYEHGAIEEGQLTAFGLVLEQFRHVAVERKRATSGFSNIREL